MDYLYLQDGFYDGEDPKEIQRFLDSIEQGKTPIINDNGVLVIDLSPVTDDLPC